MSPTAPRPPSAGPRRRGPALALLVGAALAVGFVAATHDDDATGGGGHDGVVVATPSDAAPPPPLAGQGRARESGSTAGTPRALAEGTVAPPEPPVDPPTPPPPPPGPAFLAVAPSAFVDRISADAFAPLALPRDELVGRVGAFGVRDVDGASGARFVGVARIDPEAGRFLRDPSGPEPPAVTALHGVVVGDDGAPVAGAEVLVYSSFYVRNAYYDHRVLELGRRVTGSDGLFDLRPIALDTIHFGADGEVLVTVRHPLLADVVAQRLPAILPGEETDVGRLVLPTRGAAAHGIVRDLEGRPVAGAVLRISGAFVATEYDKTERMIVLDPCPTAVTDEQGRYRIEDFAPGVHEISIHIRIDCVVHGSMRFDGDLEWSPQVRAGHAIRGHVVDPRGEPVPAAVVAGGGNWTPSNADGTFWLDNVAKGPLSLYVAHHDWRAQTVVGVPTDADELTITLTQPLPRVTLAVVDAAGAPVPLVAIDWTWPPGGGPRPFSTESRYFHDPLGTFLLVVPEGAVGATVSDAKGGTHTLEAEDLVDGVRRAISLSARPTGG